MPDLTISASHASDFARGDRGDKYVLVVSNAGGGVSTGLVTVLERATGGNLRNSHDRQRLDLHLSTALTCRLDRFPLS